MHYKEYALGYTIKALSRILPHLSDERVLALASPLLDTLEYPETRTFFEGFILRAKRFLPTLSPNCRKRAINNMFVNEMIIGLEKRIKFRQRHGFSAPTTMVISPTMKCNLRCIGCWAGEYEKKEELDLPLLNRVLNEAKEMGTYFFTITGGEPFVWKDLLNLFKRHNDCYFQVYTNGTLISPFVAKTLSELGNAFLAISVEGFEKETDARRGRGTFQKILNTMELLRKEGVPFGISVTPLRQTNELVSSDEFIEFFSERGCFLIWYFNYVPIGRSPDPSLMPTPEQRIWRYKRFQEIRKTNSIVIVDFWNDGALTGGCIAGGNYLHINAKGEVEPCAFVHFAVDNIKQKTLFEVLNSKFFWAIRKRQPYCPNLLRVCMIVDNPHILRTAVKEGGAYPTHPGADSIIKELRDKIDEYAKQYGKLADKVWKEEREKDTETKHMIASN